MPHFLRLDFSAASYSKHFEGPALHRVRNALKYVPWKDDKAVTTNLKRLYQSTTEQEASLELDRFAEK